MKFIPKQFKLSTKIGGFLTILNEVMALFSIYNFLMLTRINYYNSDDTCVREIFPSYISFMLAMAFSGVIAMIFTYMIIIPSKYKFAQEQAVKDNRSPLYDKVVTLEEKIDLLLDEKNKL